MSWARLLCCASIAGLGCGHDASGPSSPPPNFVRLQSDYGDYIGSGVNYEYTQANAVITLDATANYIRLDIRGDEQWLAHFQTPDTLSRWAPASYPAVQRYEPARGGIEWQGQGRGCNNVTGSLYVDDVTYDQDVLTAIDLRFEQHCEGGPSALRGTIHWRADDPTRPPGPLTQFPLELWRLASLPPTGGPNYVHLSSNEGDWVGQGQTVKSNDVRVIVDQGHMRVFVNTDPINGPEWDGDFQTMISINRFDRGLYPNLLEYPMHNPAKGGLHWAGQSRGCSSATGWFLVDRAVYRGNTLTALDLRFSQRCYGGDPALSGVIHWTQQ